MTATPRMARWPAFWRIGMLAVVALLLVALAQRVFPGREMQSTSPARTLGQVWGPPHYAAALEVLGRDVAREVARVGADPQSWMKHESLAMVLHARGQLTGSHEDLAAAVASADRARALAPEGSGPVLARAIVALSMHRNAEAKGEVERMAAFAIAAQPADLAEADAILGDVALYSGDYPAALMRYQAADRRSSSPGSLVRLADWHRHMGRFDEARKLLDKALADRASITPWTRASLLLQLGAIDLQTGEWDAAERRFAEADRAFPGWWLAKAHLAQMAAVRGEFERAESLYREAMVGAERPSVMDALAALYHAMGRTGEAEALERQTALMWSARVRSHPEAYADHAFEAALGAGDTARAWHLAALNYRSRPYGDGRIGLARAAEARGRNQSARDILLELEKTGWRSTEQYRVLDDVCTKLGDTACAARARKAALAISPRAYEERADLLAFGNH